MKKIVLSFVVLVALSLNVIAEGVNPNTAREAAHNFLTLKCNSKALKNAQSFDLVYTQVNKMADRQQITTFYVFNVDDRGFVIVSANDLVIPVLAYSDESIFNPEDLSPSLSWWLEEYSSQIVSAIEDNTRYESVSEQWDELLTGNIKPSKNTTSVEPFVTTLWNQTKYYNNLCPIDSAALTGNFRVRAGCVAIAMAQVINYYDYPAHGIGSHTYTYNPYGTLSADYGNTPYQWELMPDSLNEGSSPEEVLAIATFVYNLGVSVEMMYGPTGSGSYVSGGSHCADGELASTFSFGNTVSVQRSSYGTTAWLDLIQGEIDESRPVLYRGSYTSGHAFVFDGYDDDDFFHVNWGWGGLTNGYYVIDDLTPGNHNYNNSQAALIHVYPTGEIITPTKSFNFQCAVGDQSESQTIEIAGDYLTANITATLSSPFQISVDNNTWGTTATLPSEGGEIYVRYSPTSAGVHSGNVSVTCSGISSKNIQLVGYSCTDVVSEFPWNEDFESSTLPECWHQEYEHGDNMWAANKVGGLNNNPAGAASGNKNILFSSFQHSPYYTTKLVLPAFDFTEFQSPMLSFWHAQCRQPDQALFNDYLNVYYKTSANAEWTLLQSYTDACQEWTEEFIVLPDPSDEYYIAFEGVCKWGYGVALDNVSVISSPFVTVNSLSINDMGWNGDGNISPSETASLSIVIENVSGSSVENAVLTLTTASEYIDITEASFDAGDFAIGEIKTLDNIFSFDVADDIPLDGKVTFYIESEAGAEAGLQNFHFYPTGTMLDINSFGILDSEGNNNGVLDPGETADMLVNISNSGNVAAMNVTGELSSTSEYITINTSSAQYGSILSEQSKTVLYNVTLSPQAGENDDIPFTLNLIDLFGKSVDLDFEYARTCSLVFSLHDSYGDGWNGANLIVSFDDGTPSQTMTISSGSAATYTIDVSMGTGVTLTWSSGSWDSECSFTLTYLDGTSIYATSGTPSAGILYTFDVSCGQNSNMPCEAVMNLCAESSDNSVFLSWNQPQAQPVSYDIYLEDEFLASITENHYTDDDVSNGTHTYCVVAIYENCTAESTCVTVVVSGDACGAPENPTATVTDFNDILVGWEAPSIGEAQYYKVYRDNVLIAGNVIETSYLDVGLDASTEYCYTISCICAGNMESLKSDVVCAVTYNGIGDMEDIISLYPNPAESMIYVDVPTSSDVKSGKIYNALGVSVKSVKLSDGINSIDVSGLSAGVYILYIGKMTLRFVKM
ncbi:MAG: C10 family peptidase [Bacteroidales bacterium]|nr:C10 family peptidase [Bacteroidales bacterium]